jgi:NADH dehydrogenase
MASKMADKSYLTMKHVVIIGGGFGGINLIKILAKNKNFEITLIDRNNYNFFPPLLYQIATGFLDGSNISYPFRKWIRHYKNVHFRMGELQKIIPSEKSIIVDGKLLNYDHLVLATGLTTNYFGMESVKQHALAMKTLGDALTLRNHILGQLEKAATEADPLVRQKQLNVVVVGSGPTGVEISGMLADMKRVILAKDHPEIAYSGILPHICLVDGLSEVLNPMSDKTHAYARQALIKMDVDVKLGMQVKDYDGSTVSFTNGDKIETETLIWAAGVTATRYEGIPKESYGRGNRVNVDGFNSVIGIENVYAIGDISLQTHEKAYPAGHPQMAQIAIQQGKNLAKNLIAVLKNLDKHPFVYRDKGSMAIIGRNRAVVDMPNKMHFNGALAWYMWLMVHLLSLITVRNRISTLYNWIIAYFSSDQSLRMIIKPSDNT